MLEKAHHRQREDDNHGSHGGGCIKPGAARHADGRNHPDTRRAGKPAHASAVVNDEPCAQEADALHDIRGHLPLVVSDFARQYRRQKRKKRRAHADQQVGPHACGFAVEFPLQANCTAQHAGQQQPADGAIDHHHLFQHVEAERLRDLCQGGIH